jgi:predicted transcriptional regulator of viral defense system
VSVTLCLLVMRKTTKRKPPARAAKGRGGAAFVEGLTRSRELEAKGFSRVALRRMATSGELQQVARGVYAPPSFAATEHHGLAVASLLVPGGVICLLSALQFHGLGTQAPFEVWMAIGRLARKPRPATPPLRVVRFSRRALREGVETHQLEGVDVRITSAARTVADCFKYRNKIGIDVALEALRAYRGRRRPMHELVSAAHTVRMRNVMRPYLEAIAA